MKKLGLIIVVLVVLQVIFVTTALADGPYQGDKGYGYGYNHHGYQNNYYSNYGWNKHHPRYYPNYNYNYNSNYYRWNHYNYGYNYNSWYGCNPCCRPSYYGYQRSNYWY